MGTGDYSTLVARHAESERDLHAVARLRFDVYVAEHGKAYAGADHARKTLSDDLDADADIMLIEHMHAGIIATVRSNSLASARARAHYSALFDLAAFGHIPHHDIVVCSRLAVSQEHRESNVRAQLFEAVYLRRLALGTRLCFATCAPEHLPMFRCYGFCRIAAPIRDPVGGLLHRILLRLDDLEYLERVNSPFANVARLLGVAERTRTTPAQIPAPHHKTAQDLGSIRRMR
ncbi:MAG: GNAT family N-acyltransferase [Rudaea sp.]